MNFSIKRDIELISSGQYFWCESCIVAVPLALQSKDKRYCIPCQRALQDGEGEIGQGVILSQEKHGIGRTKINLPLATIKRLKLKGLNCREIADELAKDGLIVSYRTIARAIKELKG